MAFRSRDRDPDVYKDVVLRKPTEPTPIVKPRVSRFRTIDEDPHARLTAKELEIVTAVPEPPVTSGAFRIGEEDPDAYRDVDLERAKKRYVPRVIRPRPKTPFRPGIPSPDDPHAGMTPEELEEVIQAPPLEPVQPPIVQPVIVPPAIVEPAPQRPGSAVAGYIALAALISFGLAMRKG